MSAKPSGRGASNCQKAERRFARKVDDALRVLAALAAPRVVDEPHVELGRGGAVAEELDAVFLPFIALLVLQEKPALRVRCRTTSFQSAW